MPSSEAWLHMLAYTSISSCAGRLEQEQAHMWQSLSAQVRMCAKEWQDVKYTRVPSVCMKNSKGSFEEHDKERFTQYLEDVKAGKTTIASGALKPHELVREAMQHTG